MAPLGTQTLPVPDALGYTLDADVTAPLDQPPFDRSPLDGYALRAADIASASWERPSACALWRRYTPEACPSSP